MGRYTDAMREGDERTKRRNALIIEAKECIANGELSKAELKVKEANRLRSKNANVERKITITVRKMRTHIKVLKSKRLKDSMA